MLKKRHMFITRRFASLLPIAIVLLMTAQPSSAQDLLCDTAFEDCRGTLWQLIDSETVGIDVAFWYLTDESYVTKLIHKHNTGVPVRIMVDPRANEGKPVNGIRLAQLQAAGIPMRMKVGGGILHWKMMLFVGQNRLEFSAANFDPFNFVPANPYINYTDEVIFFSADTSIINSFKTKFDDMWIDVLGHADYANITPPLTRRYPIFPIHPDLVFPPGVDSTYDEFANRSVSKYNLETQGIDVIMFRLTDQRHTNALINAVDRGVVVRFLAEPVEYRSINKRWHAWNMDRLYMAGIHIKSRLHQGETHEKLAILRSQGLTIFGSSNWTSSSSNSQEEHNYFTSLPAHFQWFTNHFDRKWNATSEYGPFVPLPPAAPESISPANGASGQSEPLSLSWEGGYWAHKYDVYFGSNPNPPLIASNVTTGSIENGVVETYLLPAMFPGTTYYWRIVGKTMANLTANGPTWSFTTAGTPPPSPTVTAISPTSGTTSGGTPVTITGTGFIAGASVSIGGSPATNVNVSSSTSIIAITGARAAGVVNVVVTNPDARTGTLLNGYTYISPNPAPTVTAISPITGTTNGGTPVTITGTGFLAGASVSIGGAPATNVNVSNNTTITATTPAHAAGLVNVVVTNTDGQSGTRTNGYTYIAPPAPTVTNISPNSGTTGGGTSVTITGTGFLAGASVSLGGAAATNVNVASSTTITATTPAHAAGAVNVVVTNTDSQSGTLTSGYTYTAPTETVLLEDDFNDNSLDNVKWNASSLLSGFMDTGVALAETGQRIEIGPLLQNTGGSHYRGFWTRTTYDFNGAYSYVELVQSASTSTSGDSMFTVGNDVNNYYRVYVTAGSLFCQRRAGGVKSGLLMIPYDAVNHRYLRIRHDSVNGRVVFETAPNNAGVPGTWVQRYSEVWHTSISRAAINFELKAGTWQAEVNDPGRVIFDNFKAARP